MSEPATSETKTKENVEENYEKLKDFGENVHKEYEKLYDEMWSNLKASHLEPFSKILENDSIIMKDQDELIEIVRTNLKQQSQNALDLFWQSNNVSEALISLEMCKEKFKSYEGHKWDMVSKTPLERTRPARMRFKENRMRYLQAQIKYQNKQLEDILQENTESRSRLQDVVQQRLHIMERMTEYRKKIQLAKPEILELQQKLLEDSDNDENLVPNKDEGNKNVSKY